MQVENDVFLFREADSNLFCRERDGAFGKLTPSLIDKEMQFPKSPTRLHIHRLTQDGLEHFVNKHAAAYEILYFDDCTCITDFAPLERLKNLTAVRIERCKSLSNLWNLSENRRLRVLSIHDSKKLTYRPSKLNTSDSLEEIRFWGESTEHKYRMQSLSAFAGMASLRRIDLNNITLEDHDTSALAMLPNLETFHFDAAMLTTEEIAQICIRHPRLYGQSLGAYMVDEISIHGNVRVCGYRKPTLTLPDDTTKLNMYIESFNRIKERLSKNVIAEPGR